MRREKQFEPREFPEVIPAYKILPILLVGGIFAVFWTFLIAEDYKGNDIIFSWIGIRTELLNSIFLVSLNFYVFLGRRIPYLCDFYKRSNRAPVKTLYESQILRWTYTLLSLDDQESIMEPVYCDWIEERSDIAENGTKYDLVRLDFYYYVWFGWRIWRESRLRVIKRKEKEGIRFGKIDPLPVFPKYDSYD